MAEISFNPFAHLLYENAEYKQYRSTFARKLKLPELWQRLKDTFSVFHGSFIPTGEKNKAPFHFGMLDYTIVLAIPRLIYLLSAFSYHYFTPASQQDSAGNNQHGRDLTWKDYCTTMPLLLLSMALDYIIKTPISIVITLAVSPLVALTHLALLPSYWGLREKVKNIRVHLSSKSTGSTEDLLAAEEKELVKSDAPEKKVKEEEKEEEKVNDDEKVKDSEQKQARTLGELLGNKLDESIVNPNAEYSLGFIPKNIAQGTGAFTLRFEKDLAENLKQALETLRNNPELIPTDYAALALINKKAALPTEQISPIGIIPVNAENKEGIKALLEYNIFGFESKPKDTNNAVVNTSFDAAKFYQEIDDIPYPPTVTV